MARRPLKYAATRTINLCLRGEIPDQVLVGGHKQSCRPNLPNSDHMGIIRQKRTTSCQGGSSAFDFGVIQHPRLARRRKTCEQAKKLVVPSILLRKAPTVNQSRFSSSQCPPQSSQVLLFIDKIANLIVVKNDAHGLPRCGQIENQCPSLSFAHPEKNP